METRPMSSKGWLLVAVALIALAHMRWGVGALAFLAPVPLLGWLRANPGWRARALAGLALFGGLSLAVLKIITPPVPLLIAPMFALPMALLMWTACLAWDVARRRGPRWIAPLVFAASTAALETLQHRLTPFGSWGALAYTQLENLPLLQVSSLVGMAGVSFLVGWCAASLEAAWADPSRGLRPLAVATGVTVAAVAWGALRLGLAQPGETVMVAAIGTESKVAGFPYPSPEEMERINLGLFERTALAASRGAKVVGWTEAATLVRPEEEETFTRRLSQAAALHRIELVAAWVVPDDATGTYQNKLAWVRPDGGVAHVYHKHHPVPGEPASPGTEPLWVLQTGAGRSAAAICYDYDFPALPRAQARLGLDLAVVPSSDWRGIDPIHTQMASVRAIENGFSLLRPTRWGLSAAYDPYGRTRAWQSSFDEPAQVLVAAVPRHGVPTLYTAIGDTFALLCAAASALVVLLGVRPSRPVAASSHRTGFNMA